MFKYKKFIEECLKIVDKSGKLVPFKLNPPQELYLEKATFRDIILKARQEGFSSLIDAILFADFIYQQNSYNVIVADIEDNATGLLDRIKLYRDCFQESKKLKIPFKYDSRFEMYNQAMNSRLVIGTAKNVEFGRSRTITNLHLSEVAFYPHIEKIIAGAGQAVVEGGKFILETTANGFNEFKAFWDESKKGNTGFNPMFFKASNFYSEEFLNRKKSELKTLFTQEYPETDIESFISSGNCYFDKKALEYHLKTVNRVSYAGRQFATAI